MTPEWSAHETRPRTTHVSDKAVIRSSVALRAPPAGITRSTCARCVTSYLGIQTLRAFSLSVRTSIPPSVDPSAARRAGGMNESFVTKGEDAKPHFVRGPLRLHVSGGHLQAGGVKPAFFAYFLCGGVCQGSCRVNRYASCLYISAEARVRSGFR